VKVANLKRLPNVPFQLYHILEKEKLWRWQKDKWGRGKEMAGGSRGNA